MNAPRASRRDRPKPSASTGEATLNPPARPLGESARRGRLALKLLTDFGDAALLLPLALVMLVWLLRHQPRGVALSWVGALGLCIAAISALKVYLYACPPVPTLVSPSGHTALGLLVYGALALVIGVEQTGWKRIAVLLAGAALIAGLAGSRFFLDAHSALEIAVGTIIGIIALALFAHRYPRLPPDRGALLPLLLTVVAAVVILHGQEVRAESLLHAASRYLGLASFACLH